jgi:hypothetical protein
MAFASYGLVCHIRGDYKTGNEAIPKLLYLY